MAYSEIAYFTAQPVAHCVAFEEETRARLIARRSREAMRSHERSTR